MEPTQNLSKWHSTERLTIIGLVIALLFTVTGFEVASASIPDTNGVIHGCYKSKNHQLSVIDPATTPACKSGSTPLNWNQSGSSVIEGSKLSAGAQPFVQNGGNGTVVATLSLAPGNYEVIAKLVVFNNSVSVAFDGCDLNGSGTSFDIDEINVPSLEGSAISLQSEVSLSGAISVSITCFDYNGIGGQSANMVKMTAIQATSVSTTSI
jgi:hypothetical protein